jgi:hypothetical protein
MLMLRPVRTVRVTTKEELDAALATADQITVEGDDELLSYAANKAAGDPANRVAIETRRSGDRPVVPSAPPVPSSSPSGSRKAPIVAAAAVIASVSIGAVIWLFAGRSAPSLYPGIGTGGGGPTGENEFWANAPSLLWPLVAIVAIIALFLIARQAISSGSNVTISWKVTEKVSGRVVITKVRERAPSKRAVA